MTTPTSNSFDRPDLRLSWAGATDVGKRRKVNEDRFVIGPNLWVVADGMGGHAAGDVASRIVADTCAELLAADAITIEALTDAIESANTRVLHEAVVSGNAGMGTTVVGVALIDNGGDDSLVVFHVGDSRCYRFGADGLVQLTKDHSHVQELVDSGEVAPEAAATHPYRNVVTRAVGIDPVVLVDYAVIEADESFRILLCSDGVSGELTDDEMAKILGSAATAEQTTGALLDAVDQGPARDNATAVVVDVALRTQKMDSPDDDEVTGPRPGSLAELISDVPGSSDEPTLEHDALRVEIIDEVPS